MLFLTKNILDLFFFSVTKIAALVPHLFICLFVLLFVSRSFVVQNLILHFSGTLIDNYYSSRYLNTPFHPREVIFHCLFQFYILDVLRGNCTVIVVFE